MDRADRSELIAVPLTDDERVLLVSGLSEWGGPARCTHALALAMGFADVDALLDEGRFIRAALQARRPMTRNDWTRALLATEIVFVSDVVGSGVDWETTTGLRDTSTLRVLRSLQIKLTLTGVVTRLTG